MSFALSSGVSGLNAHQTMIDVAGNNIANVNTTAFKSSRVNFSELLSQSIKKASQPSTNIGGTNPQQIGTGVGVSGITPSMAQGNIVKTGNPLDLAIEGEGYFTLSDGSQNIYTRAGVFAVDQDSTLVDPNTGYRVQRIGSVGEGEGFQTASVTDIKIPYDVTLPANATSEITVSGNLSADGAEETPFTQVIESELNYTTSGAAASGTTLIKDLEQYSGTLNDGSINIAGYQKDGTVINDDFAIDDTTTMQDLIDEINSVLTDGTAQLTNGAIKVTDGTGGYSQTDLALTYSGDGELEVPAYFKITTVGGEEVKTVNITAYDTLGGKHTLSGAFVRTDMTNQWDLLLTTITGDVSSITPEGRRIKGITFDPQDGSYAGITGGDTATFDMAFKFDPSVTQTITFNLGTEGKLDGLTQFAGNSTAVAREQDGYSSGRLASVSVNQEGVVIGAFSNGIKKNVAAMQVALFQNASGLESIGGGYFIPSANSGEAIATQALTGGAGSVHGGSLERSNVDVATEFVTLIQAQNGYQANARTISIANQILQELSNLIR
jgi:flagellar hook protein FlgE